MGGLTGCSRRIGTMLEKAITCGVVMKDEFEEKARELVENWQKDPWPEQLVQDIAKARQAEYLRGRESMREDILTTLKDYCVTPYPLMPQAENHWWYEAIDNFKKKFIEYVRQPRSHQEY